MRIIPQTMLQRDCRRAAGTAAAPWPRCCRDTAMWRRKPHRKVRGEVDLFSFALIRAIRVFFLLFRPPPSGFWPLASGFRFLSFGTRKILAPDDCFH
jgi:hypothetical protein